ncbi:zonular occludens toxin domain-containing protein [Actinokineospora sp.]|uniref:zonular occludens toxin domain-containing protein n=1 Tax=Actinokineospora sp. TaxID=1872133 RepID=UPI003D6B97B8
MSAPNTHRPHGMDNVIPLRTNGSDVELDIIDAEIVAEDPDPTVRIPGTAIERADRRTLVHRAAKTRDVVYATARRVHTVATHDTTLSVGKTVARNAWYPFAGAGAVVRRWRDTHGASRYERQMRAAEAAGEWEKLQYWQEADVAEKQRRHDRVMDWMRAPAQLLKAAGLALVGLAGFLLVVGIILAFNSGNIADVIAPISAVVSAVAFVVWFLTAYGVLLLTVGTAGGLVYLYRQGRAVETPQWMTVAPKADTDQMDVMPDEGTIVNALRNLNIPGFNRALKEGWRMRFLMPPTLDGKGWRCQISLPPASPVEEIVKRKATLAHNLVRFPNEVWPTEPQATVLDLWVANPGALSGPVDPWPLLATLDTERCDYFKGVPVAVTIKGDTVNARLSEANHVYGGMMGSGKSTMVITLLAGASLDPLVDIDVVVMAENADYEPMRPRLRSLITGAGQDTVDTCMAMLTALYQELSTRGQALREHDERAVTRALAQKDARLRPRILVVDECQNLFMGEHGKAAIEVASKLMSTARKYAITLVFLTPEPSKDACPRKITSVASNKACYAIGDHQANDAILGTGSYKSGISAVGLTPKTDDGPGDVGTCMARGFTAQPALLRTFYLSPAELHQVTDRAMQLRAQAGLTPAPAAPTAPAKVVDHLADIATVLGGKTLVRHQEVLALLAQYDADTYTDWTPADLRAALPDEAKPYKTRDGSMHVNGDRVRDALANRDTDPDTDSDDWDGED